MNRTCHRRKLFGYLLPLCISISILISAVHAHDLSLERGKGQDPIDRTFDEAKNETTVSIVPDFIRKLAGLILTNSPDLQTSPTHQTGEFTLQALSYSYQGNVPARPQTVNFIFLSDGRKPKYKDTPEFRIDVDGSAITQGKIDYGLKDSPLGKVEVLTAPVATELFFRIARAAKVQFSFGTKTYKLSGSEKKDMRALADTIP